MSDAWAPPAEIQMHLPGAGTPALLIFKSPAGGFSEEEEPEEPGEGTENSQLHVGVSENAARSLCLPSLPPRRSAPPPVGWGPTGAVWSAAPRWIPTVRPRRGLTRLRDATSVRVPAGKWETGAR